MAGELSEANRALIEAYGANPGLNWAEEFPATLNRLLNAARSEGPHPEQIAENANCSSPGQLLAESASYSGSGKMTANHVPRAEKAVPHPESGETVAFAELVDDLMQGFADPYINSLTLRAAKEIARLDALLGSVQLRLNEFVASKGEALPVVSEEIAKRIQGRVNAAREDHNTRVSICLGDAEAAIAALSLPRPASDKGEEAVCWVSPEQFAAHADPEDSRIAGTYLPVRKTRAGQFTQPLYARPSPGVSREPDKEAIAAAIEDADAGFGYDLNLIRLVDGVSTYRLKIAGSDSVTEHEDTEEAYEIIRLEKCRRRADAILSLISRGEG